MSNPKKAAAIACPRSSTTSSSSRNIEQEEDEEEEWKTVRIKNHKESFCNKGNYNKQATKLEKKKATKLLGSVIKTSIEEIPDRDEEEQYQETVTQIDECISSLWSCGRDSFLCDMIFGCLCLYHDGGQDTKIHEIVCYGIGNFSWRFSAEMLQMACVLLLRYLLDTTLQQQLQRSTTTSNSHMLCYPSFCNNNNKLGLYDQANSATTNEEILYRDSIQSFLHSLDTIGFVSQLHEHYKQQHSTIIMSFYDPCMTALEKRILEEHYNVVPIAVNEQGKRQVCHKTIFYMPHCPMRLYSNVLWANWDILAKGSVIIIGNSLLAYNDNIITHRERYDRTNAILPIAPFVMENKLRWKRNSRFETNTPTLSNVLRAFNDFSVSHFSSSHTNTTEWPPRPEEFFLINSETSELR